MIFVVVFIASIVSLLFSKASKTTRVKFAPILSKSSTCWVGLTRGLWPWRSCLQHCPACPAFEVIKGRLVDMLCSITAPHNGKQIRCVILTFSQVRERFFKEPLDNQTCVFLELRIHRNQHWILNRGELRGRRGQQSRGKGCIASWLCLHVCMTKLCASHGPHWCVWKSSPGVVLKETHSSSHAAEQLKGMLIG